MHDLGADFWGPAFTFLGVCVASVAGLVKMIYFHKKRSNIQKANLEISVEMFKATEAGRFVVALKKVVDEIKPLVENHNERLKKFDETIATFQSSQAYAIALSKELKLYYDEFHSRMTKVQAGGALVMDRLKKMETEIIDLKNGKILVRTKKNG